MERKKATKKKAGAARWSAETVARVRKVLELGTAAGKGLAEIARDLGMDEKTFYAGMKERPELKDALKQGRFWQAQRVIESMFRRATGYEYEETKQVGSTTGVDAKTGKPVPKSTRIEKAVKHVPPDVRAATLLLKNLLPGEFKDRQDHGAEQRMNLRYDSLALLDRPGEPNDAEENDEKNDEPEQTGT